MHTALPPHFENHFHTENETERRKKTMFLKTKNQNHANVMTDNKFPYSIRDSRFEFSPEKKNSKSCYATISRSIDGDWWRVEEFPDRLRQIKHTHTHTYEMDKANIYKIPVVDPEINCIVSNWKIESNRSHWINEINWPAGVGWLARPLG